MPLVIADASPPIALAEIGQLELLRLLFGAIVIPPAVHAEITSEPAHAGLQAAIAEGWITVQAPRNAALVRLLRQDLDPGEGEAIALAQEDAPTWIILDDLAARHKAEALGLPVIGTLGVLLKAKDLGHLQAIKPLLDHFQQSGFRLSDELYARVLEQAGEAL